MTTGAARGNSPSNRMKRRRTRSKKKLRVNDRVEVRSQEDGFLGSWHQGVVMACGYRRRCVKYDHILVDDGSESFIEHVEVPPYVDGIHSDEVHQCQYRGSIRPLPPYLVIGPWDLPYGSCVDVYHMEAWWEGVIFDHNDGSKERNVFFPDLGDEMLVKLGNMRATPTWDEINESWHRRGPWLFLEVIQECEQDWPLPVSVKQMWYDLRGRDDFRGIKEWTSTDRGAWRCLVLETILENLMVVLQEALPSLAISGNICTWLLNMPKIDSGPQVESVDEGFIDCRENLLTPCAVTELSRTDENNGVDIGMLRNKSSEIDVQLFQKVHNLDRLVEGADGKGSNMNSYIMPSKSFPKEPILPLTAIGSPQRLPKLSFPSRLSVEMDVKAKDHICRKRGHWQPAGPDFVPGAEPFPDAITLYIRGKNTQYNDSLIARVHQHLLYLGWKIEFRVDKEEIFRFHYISPAGKCYQSLFKACIDITGAIKETRSAFSDDTSNSFIATDSPLVSKLPDSLKDCQPCPAQEDEDPNKASPMPRLEAHENLSTDTREAQSMHKKRKREIPTLSLKDRSYNYQRPARKLDGVVVNNRNHQEDKTSGSRKPKAKASGSNSRGVRSDGTRRLRSNKRIKVAAPNLLENNPRTVISWLIENEALLPGTKLYYCSKYNSRAIAQGRVNAEGIMCDCCSNMFTLRTFGIHAANSDRRAASKIFLEDGRSLLNCQMKILHEKNEKNNARGRRETNWQKGENDSICSICHYGGELVLCDECPSSYHQSCIGMSEIPDGEWFCPSCCCRICNQSRSRDLAGNGVDDRTLTCDQCNSKYHFDCITDEDAKRLYNLPGRNWFCSKKCEEIYVRLYKMIGKAIPVGKDNLTWTLLRSLKVNSGDLEAYDIDAITQIDCKLNLAVSVMHDCFEDVSEPSVRGEIIENVVFSRGSELNRLNFQGFYTAVLEKNDDLISVANIRIHGDRVAEAPLVCTRFQYRRHGMCHLLMDLVEKMLKELGVYTLVLPSIPSVLDAWTTSFGFMRTTEFERLRFLGYTFLDFQDTIMCHKQLLAESPMEPSLLAGNVHDVCNDASKNRENRDDPEGSAAISAILETQPKLRRTR